MRSKSFFIVFLVMVFLGLGLFYFIRFGFYPVAFVNTAIVSARHLDQAVDSVRHYYSQAAETYSPAGTIEATPGVVREIRRATLDKLIENVLIYQELKTRVGSDFEDIVENKIMSLKLNTPNFEKAIATLYGLDLERFKKVVLKPQAQEEILEGRLTLENTDFKKWLEDKRRGASIIILATDLYWDGGKVAVK